MKRLERENEILKKQLEDWSFAFKMQKETTDSLREKFRKIKEILEQ